MNVLLLNQPWINDENQYALRAGVRWPQIRKRDRSMPYYSFPYALACATSYLKANGINAVLRDSIALGEKKEQALIHIAENAYDVIVLETSTASVKYDIDFCNAIKAQHPQTIVCLSGQHATAMPEDILRSSRADYVLIGEYEKTLKDLCRLLISGEVPTATRVQGLAYLYEGQLFDGGRRELLDSSELPSPYRDPVIIHKYNEPSARFFPNATVTTSRGCSFQCTFCVEASVNYGSSSSFRYRPLEMVREEILELVDTHGIKEIFFDDAFLTNKRALEVSEMMRNLPARLHWSCWIDRSVPEETLRKMKIAGCSGVKFGVETFDPEIGLAAKKKVRQEDVEALIQRCRKVGLLTHASYIFGLPGETRKTLENTLQTATSLKTTSFQASIAVPIPGTELFEQARKNDWLRTTNWNEYEGQNSSVIKYKDLRESDLIWAMGQARRLKLCNLLKNPLALSAYLIKLMRMMGPKEFFLDMKRKTAFLFGREIGSER